MQDILCCITTSHISSSVHTWLIPAVPKCPLEQVPQGTLLLSLKIAIITNYFQYLREAIRFWWSSTASIQQSWWQSPPFFLCLLVPPWLEWGLQYKTRHINKLARGNQVHQSQQISHFCIRNALSDSGCLSFPSWQHRQIVIYIWCWRNGEVMLMPFCRRREV